MLAARAEKQPEDAANWQLGGSTIDVDQRLSPIPFCGPPGTIPQVSFDKLFRESAEDDPDVMALAGKIVLIAATYHAAQDVHPTPYVPQLMQGAEIHAQIAEALLTSRRIGSLPAWLIGLMIALSAALASALLASRQGIVLGGVATLVALFGLVAISYLAWLFDTDLPIGGVQLTLVAGWVLGLALGMRGSERRRAELKKMFGRYVSDDVVEHLLRSGTTPDLGGEERYVTVLFSDIRSFTTLSEKLEATSVVEVLNEWFSRINGAILANGGTIDKYIGDAIMAVFGAPVAHPDHARRALSAADAMNQEVARMRGWLNERHPDLDLPSFRIGVGLHTGKAVIGNVGSAQRMEFTTIGDTVNSASRIEGLTKEMGAVVVISREVVEAAGGGLVLGDAQFSKVKGRAEPLEVMPFHGFENSSDPATATRAENEDGNEHDATS
jgi:adenylate cyclase